MEPTLYKYIDLQSIKEDTFGDVEILRMIIDLFIEGIDEYVDALNNEFPRQNWQVLFQATHKIKPNISMFGMAKLVPVILELENSFKNEQNLDAAEELVKDSISIFRHVKTELLTELKLIPNE